MQVYQANRLPSHLPRYPSFIYSYRHSDVFFLHRHPDAGETKTTSKCCFGTTGEDRLMSRNGSDGEFSGRVTEASVREARKI
jgi:hypothetical protein